MSIKVVKIKILNPCDLQQARQTPHRIAHGKHKQEGYCDLQQEEGPDHNVISGGLKMDLLRRTKVYKWMAEIKQK